MSQTTTYIVDLFDEIARLTAKRSQINLYYQYGHPAEVIESIAAMSKSRKVSGRRFPLLALFMDFDETKGERSDVQSSVSLHVIIATSTKPLLKAKQRYEETFRSRLYPLYEAFIYSIQTCGYFINVQELVSHTKTDRLFWGKNGLYGNTNNEFQDYIDAIEITNLKLQTKQNICIPTNSA
jgi:hypothetical protein